MGDYGIFLFIPVGGGQAYCYADAAVDRPFDDPLGGRLERLRARFASYASPAHEALAQLQSPEQVHFEQTRRCDRIRSLPPVVRNLMTRFLANSVYQANYAPLAAEP